MGRLAHQPTAISKETVYLLVCFGHTQQEIGSDLGICEWTLARHYTEDIARAMSAKRQHKLRLAYEKALRKASRKAAAAQAAAQRQRGLRSCVCGIEFQPGQRGRLRVLCDSCSLKSYKRRERAKARSKHIEFVGPPKPRNKPGAQRKQIVQKSLAVQGKKHCWTCDITKPFQEFRTAKASWDGLCGYCRPCQDKKKSEWKRNNPDKIKAWEECNADHIKAYRQAHYRKTLADDLVGYRARSKQRYLKNKHLNLDQKRARQRAYLQRPEIAERYRAAMRRRYAKDIDSSRAARRAKTKRLVETLSASYVAETLGLSVSTAPPALIKLKREYLRLKRLLVQRSK